MHETTVYVAEQDPAVRDAWAAQVQSWGMKARGLATCDEVLDALSQGLCGCLVLDLDLPDVGGLELWKQVLARGLRPALIMTAEKPAVSDVVQAVKAGAIDVLEKPVAAERLRESIQFGLRQFAEESPRVKQRAQVQQRLEQLTKDEQTVMRLLLSNRSMQQIADELELSLRTIHLRRARLLEKMQVATRLELAQLVMTVDGFGSNGFGTDGMAG